MTHMWRSRVAVIDDPIGNREFGGNGTVLFPDADFCGHPSLTAITQAWLENQACRLYGSASST
jgi:hypothetical protein